ncbi:MAG: helix-turn-helix domain-containing protein [Clostridia bacterium]|nr:helix-turn-helix domain-containing protein [Clostridia bacterium]
MPRSLFRTFSGIQDCQPSHRFGPAIRETYLLHYVLSGKGVFSVRRKKYELSAGEGFFIYPGEVTVYAADRLEPWSYFWTGIEKTPETEEVLAARGLRKTSGIFSFDRDSSGIKTVREILNGAMNTTHENAAALFYLAIQSVETEKLRPESASEIYMKAVDYMEERFATELTVEGMAKHLNVSRSNLYRIFMKETQRSPQRAILDFRLDKARRMKESGDLSLTQIAFSCGFCDLSHFSKAYKDYRARYGLPEK